MSVSSRHVEHSKRKTFFNLNRVCGLAVILYRTLTITTYLRLNGVIGETEYSTDQRSSENAEADISLLDILIVLARRKSLIIKVFFATVLLSVGLSLLMGNLYTATTSLLPPQNSASGLLSQLSGLGSLASIAGGGLSMKNPSDLEMALLKSQTVEDAMIDRYHLMERLHLKRRSEARTVLEGMAKIESAKNGLINISVTDGDPKRAADMANGYVEEFRKFSATLAVTEASQRRLFFQQQLALAKDDLSNAEEQFKTTEQKTGVLQIDAQTRVVIESVAQLRAQIAAKEVQIRAMQAFATEENPQLQVATEELAALKQQQEKLGSSSDSSEAALLVPKGNMQQSQMEYIRRFREVRYYETIFELMARQYELAKVDEARQGAQVQVVDPATVPDHHSSPKRRVIVLGAGVVGLLIGVAWVLISEGLARLERIPSERTRLLTLRGLLSFRKRARA
jgi:tyrosine-protein kinase Etk/Wzc